jgi:hypothetical protein
VAESGVRPEPTPVYRKEPWVESEQSAKLRCTSENVEELLDRVERELLVWLLRSVLAV